MSNFGQIHTKTKGDIQMKKTQEPGNKARFATDLGAGQR